MDRILEEQLFRDIQEMGYSIGNFTEILRLKTTHKNLVPLLLRYLNQFEGVNFKEGIVRALGVKGFTDATEILIDEFISTDHSGYKWAIANSLSLIMDKRYISKYIEIVKDRTHRTSRQMVAILLGKLRSQEALTVLIELLNDEDICGHVVTALGYYKNPEIIKHIEPFLKHEKKWIQREAEKTLKKIRKNNE